MFRPCARNGPAKDDKDRAILVSNIPAPGCCSLDASGGPGSCSPCRNGMLLKSSELKGATSIEVAATEMAGLSGSALIRRACRRLCAIDAEQQRQRQEHKRVCKQPPPAELVWLRPVGQAVDGERQYGHARFMSRLLTKPSWPTTRSCGRGTGPCLGAQDRRLPLRLCALLLHASTGE
jgi:hypothetical protein